MVQNTKVKNSEQANRQVVVAVIAVVAILVAAGAIAFFFLQGQDTINYSAIPQNRTADGAFVLGNPEAPITIVAWEDFLCPHCQAYESTLHQFFKEYVETGKARFEFRMMIAIDQTYSSLAFQLVECSEELQEGSFWKARETMFGLTSTSRFGASSGREFAQDMGIPYGSLLDCTSEASQFVTDQTLAQQYGEQVTGTPAVAWRLNNGDIRFDFISRQPTVAELGALVSTFSNQ